MKERGGHVDSLSIIVAVKAISTECMKPGLSENHQYPQYQFVYMNYVYRIVDSNPSGFST